MDQETRIEEVDGDFIITIDFTVVLEPDTWPEQFEQINRLKRKVAALMRNQKVNIRIEPNFDFKQPPDIMKYSITLKF